MTGGGAIYRMMESVGARPKLRGKARQEVMQLYLRGEITWHEAAIAIGVHSRTIARCTPKGFKWEQAREEWVAKRLVRLPTLRQTDETP